MFLDAPKKKAQLRQEQELDDMTLNHCNNQESRWLATPTHLVSHGPLQIAYKLGSG